MSAPIDIECPKCAVRGFEDCHPKSEAGDFVTRVERTLDYHHAELSYAMPGEVQL
jgi:hypothetical protein